MVQQTWAGVEDVHIVSRIPAEKATAVGQAGAGNCEDDEKWLDWGCTVTTEQTVSQ